MNDSSRTALLSRRDFVRSAALLPVIAAGASTALAATPAPIQRAGGPRLKVGLNAYSFSDLLLENLKDKSKGLDLFQL
jgi:hypothetical protein